MPGSQYADVPEPGDVLLDANDNVIGGTAESKVTLQAQGGVLATYDTIGAAIAVAPAGSVITVPPGSWAESFTIPAGVTVMSTGGRRATYITGAAATGTRVTMPSNSALIGFKVGAPTDAVGAIKFTGTTTQAHVSDVAIIGNGGSGIGIEMAGTARLRLDNLGYPSGNLAAFILQTAGVIIARDITIVTTGSCTDVFKIEGGYFGFEATFVIATGTVTDGIHVSGSAIVLGSGIQFDNCANAIHIAGNSAEFDVRDLGVGETNVIDMIVDDPDAKIRMAAGHMHRDKVFIPGDASDVLMEYIDDFEGDESLVIDGELAVGDLQRGKESVFGEGDSYVRNMVVITTDDTAGAAADGGNLTDVSTEAASASGSTFSFQGVDANHAIMWGSNNLDALADALKHWGIKVKQTVAAAEIAAKSFAFELWNGAAWVELDVMATQSSNFYRYANEVFVRANSSEHIRFGITGETTWVKKTISSKNLYWARVRITDNLTTAPVFEQFKLSSSRFEANADGTNTFHGRSRFRKTIAATGNVFGESGSVGSVTVGVGSGGVPTGWNHNIKNSELNGNADAIMMQMSLPRGIDTGQPIKVEAVVIGTPGGADPPTTILSVLPVEVEGVLVADPAFGTSPTARTLANTETVTAKVAQTSTDTTTVMSSTKIGRIDYGNFDVSDYYEGDALMLRMELDDDGSDNVDVAVLQLEVSGVLWTHGDRL